MGKPIAGQDQFPYTVGGFLVDGANINGVTYAKKLYIYKQRSYDMYDLQDVDGNIFRFIRIGYKDTSGNMLNYFDVAEELVETIPVNTFFLKIQDPSRNIFSFVRIYQWHKCITVEGDYVFRTAAIDPTLSGVLINPTISTIPVGKSLAYKSIFYPSNYSDLDGNWYMNSLDGIRDNQSAEIISTNLNNAVVKGNTLGKAVLTFVPKRNNALVTHSVINVVQESQPVQEFTVQSVTPYNAIKTGDEYTLEVVTFPYDAVLTEALSISIEEAWNSQTTTTLISVSDDFKSYTFKSILADLPPPIIEDGEEPYDEPDIRQLDVTLTFNMKSPIEYSYVYGDARICSDAGYTEYYSYPGLLYYPPRGLRPNMTWKCKCEISGPNQTVYPYVSSDPEIATFDHLTGTISTHSKTGKVTFTTQYDKVDGSGVGQDAYAMQLTVREDMYDYITCEPQNVDTVSPGQEFNVKFTGYREGQDPVAIPAQLSGKAGVYSVKANGDVKIEPNAPIGEQIYVSPNVTLDYQVIADYNSTGIKPVIRNSDNLVPMTQMVINYYTYYLRYSDNPDVQNWDTLIVYNRPNNCSSYMKSIDSYDNTIVEVIDEADAVGNQTYAMGGSLYAYIKGLKRGSTEMVISSVSDPTIKLTINIVVF